MNPWYLVAFWLVVVVALVCALLYRKWRDDQSAYTRGYEVGIQLLLGSHYDAYVWTLSPDTKLRTDAYTRGLFKALEDNK